MHLFELEYALSLMSWQGLAEIAATVGGRSSVEKRKQLIGLWLGPLLLIHPGSRTLPEVTSVGMRPLGIFLWTVTWWVSKAIPIPATSLTSMMLVLCGVLTVEAAFTPGRTGSASF